MCYFRIIFIIIFLLVTKTICGSNEQIEDTSIFSQILEYMHVPYFALLYGIETSFPSFSHGFPDSWQLYFFIPGSILIDIGLLILVFAISLDARHTVQKPDKIVLSLALIIPGVILNYILGWIAYLIKTMI